jgi:Rrf2 family cysteine metabolism transcriptional repressor
MISNKCYYALKAMLELAIREGSGPVTIGDIAAKQHIPVRFLEAILRQLKQAGFADSVRGKDGGYYLSAPAKSVTVGAIIRLFEGPLIAINTNGGGPRRHEATDVFQHVWDQAEEALGSVFDMVHFGKLADEYRSREAANVANYSI